MRPIAGFDSEQVHIGRYFVEARLGEGGMANTWLCRLEGSKGFTKRYVLKTLKPQCRSDQYLSMFADEARLGARFEHPNLCPIIELGEVNGAPFMVQEFVDGPNLSTIMTQQAAHGFIDVPFGVRVIADIAGALYWVHHLTDEEGRHLDVVHRDISLSNILVSRQGVAKLIDFGVARFWGRDTHTEHGLLKGRLRYMAPEVLSTGVTSHQSDLYSLGVCLYSVVTGQSGPRPDRFPLSAGADGIEPDLASIIRATVDPDPQRRWKSSLGLKDALEAWLERSGGGRVTSADLAARIGELFPRGSDQWRTEEFTASVTKGELTSDFGTMPETVAPRRASGSGPGWLVRTAAVALIGGALVGSLVVLGQRRGAEPVDPGHALLDRAESALVERQLEPAAAALAAADRLGLTGPDQARHGRLDGLVLAAQIQDVRSLATRDRAAALVAASALAVARPTNEELAALVESLQPPTAAPPASAPAPSDPPSEAPSGLFGARVGRPVRP